MASTMSRPRVSSGDEIQGSTLLALFAALVALNALVAPHLAGCPIGDGGSGAKGTGGTCAATDASIGGSRDVAVFAAAAIAAPSAVAAVTAAIYCEFEIYRLPPRSRYGIRIIMWYSKKFEITANVSRNEKETKTILGCSATQSHVGRSSPLYFT